MPASGDGRTRPLCPTPQTAIYTGGDPNLAASFRCGGRNKLDDPGSCKSKGRHGDDDDDDDNDD